MEILFYMWRLDFEWFLSTKYSALSLGWYCWWFRNPIPNHLGWCLNLVNNGISNTNLNWFSRRISDINNMPPKKRTVFLRFPDHRFQHFGCVKCFCFCWFLPPCCRFLVRKFPPWNKTFSEPEKMDGDLEDFFRFLFGETRLPGGYLNPTPKATTQGKPQGPVANYLSDAQWSCQSSTFEEEETLGPSYVSEKVSWNLIWYQCHDINQYCTWFCNGVCVYISSVYNALYYMSL